MGGENKQTQTQTSTVKPLDFAMPGIQGVTNQVTGLLDQTGMTPGQSQAYGNITETARGYEPQFQGLLSNAFSGGGVGDYNQNIINSMNLLKEQMTPIAQGQNLNVAQNPYLNDIISQNNDAIRNQVGSAFAGAGRSFSGAHMGALGKALADSANRIRYNAYNDERNRQVNALNQLFGASVQGAGALDASALNNYNVQQSAPGLLQYASAGDYAALDEENAKFQIPTQNLGALSNIIVPIAGLGRQIEGQTEQIQELDPLAQVLGFGATAAGTVGKFIGL